jgi:CTP:molybdopterin cytidylyltransferase MocA
VEQQVDAIILAGDRGAARPVGEVTKALLPLGGKPLLHHVLHALDGVQRLRRLVVVGPTRALAPAVTSLSLDKPLVLLEQCDTAYQNFWRAFTHLQGDPPGDPDCAVLLAAADTPLISAREVDEFLDGCDLQQHDFCIGMTDARHLSRFYPTAQAPGIRARYLHLEDGSLRVNNLHLLKPLKVANREYVETIYECRYQGKLWNMLRSARGLLSESGMGWRAVHLYALLQLAQWADALAWEALRRRLSRHIHRDTVCAIASRVLRTRATIVETTLGGCAIDVDSPADYAALQARWAEFSRLPSQGGD